MNKKIIKIKLRTFTKCCFALYVLFFLFSLLKVEAATETKVNSSFPDTINYALYNKDVDLGIKSCKHHNGIVSTIQCGDQSKILPYILLKSFSSGSTTGKAMCTKIKANVPGGGTVCKAVAWNSDATKNKRIAAGIAAIIKKARDLSGGSSGAMSWGYYYYSEMAINTFLYNYNGKKTDNNPAKAFIGFENVSSTKAYQNLLAAGENAYKNFGKAEILLSNPTLVYDKNSGKLTATVNATCRYGGKAVACDLSSNKVGKNVMFSYRLTNGTEVENDSNLSVSQEIKKTKDKNVYVIKYVTTINNVKKAWVQFDIDNKYKVAAAQNYNCGSSVQTLTPNWLKNIPGTVSNIAMKSVNVSYPQTPNEPEPQPDDCYFKIEKDDMDNHPLEGVEFTLYDSQKKKIESKTTNINGRIKFKNLTPGAEYYVKETKTLDGYVLNSEERKIVMPADRNNCHPGENMSGLNANFFQNEPKTVDLKINKVDLDGKQVPGAKIRISSSDEIVSFESEDDNGNNGYEGLEYTENVEVSETSTDESNEDDNSVNSDETNIKYAYFNENNEYIGNYTSVEDCSSANSSSTCNDFYITGEQPLVLTGLKPGDIYSVEELSVPEGTDYAIKVGMDSTILSDEDVNELTLINNKSSFYISKQDIANAEELPGATLTITNNIGIVIDEWVSTDSAQLIEGLSDGTYILTETTAPNGYKVAESIKFEIEEGRVKGIYDENDELKTIDDNTIVMYDSSEDIEVDIPDTFSTKNIITMIIGLLLVSAGTGVLVYEYKIKKRA